MVPILGELVLQQVKGSSELAEDDGLCGIDGAALGGAALRGGLLVLPAFANR